MDDFDFLKWSAEAAKWADEYRSCLSDRPVRSQAAVGDTLRALPEEPPEEPEDFGAIMDDFRRLVPPGITHWQHPRFFAYFPANSSPASVIAEHLTAAIAANCMLWQTSPVGTEMEIRTLEWLAKMFALPEGWKGVIQDGASSATFAAAVTARERALDWQGMERGLAGGPVPRFYLSEHSHSSATKGLLLAGIGRENIIEVPTDGTGSMYPGALRDKVQADRKAGLVPAGVMAVVGATSIGVSDDLEELGKVVEEEGLYGHVDAAWAGSAALCPEHRGLLAGLERWDSYVFNPHKWLGTNFDLSAHFLKDASLQVRAMAAQPDYLRTQHADDTVDFSTWTAPLGRRFRALKLWFTIRAHGASGLREMIRNHVKWAQDAARKIEGEDGFELACEPKLSLFVFRHVPGGIGGAEADAHNRALLDAVNADGFCYLTQTVVDGRYAIRFQVGSMSTSERDVTESVDRVVGIARKTAGEGNPAG